MRLLNKNGSLPFPKVWLAKLSVGRNLPALLVTAAIFAFLSFQNQETLKICRNSAFPKPGSSGDSLDFILSLKGKWVSDDGSYIEEWESDADTLLTGVGYEVKDGKKLRTEKLAMVYEKGGFYYQATVSGQNGGRTITFGPAVFSGSTVFFENSTHDFPNILRYTFAGDSLLKVSVESNSDPSMNFQIDLKKDGSESRQK